MMSGIRAMDTTKSKTFLHQNSTAFPEAPNDPWDKLVIVEIETMLQRSKDARPGSLRIVCQPTCLFVSYSGVGWAAVCRIKFTESLSTV